MNYMIIHHVVRYNYIIILLNYNDLYNFQLINFTFPNDHKGSDIGPLSASMKSFFLLYHSIMYGTSYTAVTQSCSLTYYFLIHGSMHASVRIAMIHNRIQSNDFDVHENRTSRFGNDEARAQRIRKLPFSKLSLIFYVIHADTAHSIKRALSDVKILGCV